MNTLQALALEYDGIPTGFVYVMEFKYSVASGTKTIYKVGITTNEPVDRMLQICREFFMKKRYVPECRLIRMRKVPEYTRLEKELHDSFKEFNYRFKSFNWTEYFDMDLEVLLDKYDNLVPLKGNR